MRIFGGKSAGPVWAGPRPGLGGGVSSGATRPGPSSTQPSKSALHSEQAHKPGLMDSWYREEICFVLVFFFNAGKALPKLETWGPSEPWPLCFPTVSEPAAQHL